MFAPEFARVRTGDVRKGTESPADPWGQSKMPPSPKGVRNTGAK